VLGSLNIPQTGSSVPGGGVAPDVGVLRSNRITESVVFDTYLSSVSYFHRYSPLAKYHWANEAFACYSFKLSISQMFARYSGHRC